MSLRAIVRQYGAPQAVIALEQSARPAPDPDDIEMRIVRAAINPSDLIPVTGAYRARTTLPFVPGFEGIGIVTRCGAAVTGFRPGDRVLPIGASGLWQQHLLRPANWCFAVPDDLSDDAAAFSYINPLTAFRLMDALRQHDVTDGRIGVTAAGSAIGRMLLHLLSADGFSPVAIVRSAKTAATLSPTFTGEIVVQASDAAPLPALDAVLDAVGGDAGARLFSEALRPGGLFVQYGALAGAQIDPARIIARQNDATFTFLWLRNWVHAAGRQALEAAFNRSFAGIRAGTLGSAIDSIHALADLPDALARQDDPQRAGKVLIAP